MPKRMRLLKPKIHKLVDDLLDDVAAKGAGGAVVDLMDLFCAPLPITVVCDLIGVPEEERVHIREWGEKVFSQSLASPQGIGEAMARALVERRANPQDDLLSDWAQVTDEEGNLLDPGDLSHFAIIMFAAGYDTTMGMLSCSSIGLMREPEKARRLAEADDDELPKVMEEMFRMYSPTQRGFRRFAREDFTLGGKQISAGDTVLVSIGAADRDPEQFPERRRAGLRPDREQAPGVRPRPAHLPRRRAGPGRERRRAAAAVPALPEHETGGAGGGTALAQVDADPVTALAPGDRFLSRSRLDE